MPDAANTAHDMPPHSLFGDPSLRLFGGPAPAPDRRLVTTTDVASPESNLP